jgi:hypothetical protein
MASFDGSENLPAKSVRPGPAGWRMPSDIVRPLVFALPMLLETAHAALSKNLGGSHTSDREVGT